jgi:hypothetical protein
MSFQFPTPPDASTELMELNHYKHAMDAYDTDAGLMDDNRLRGWFLDNVCELAFGEDAMYNYSPREIFEKLEEFSKDAQKWTDILEEHDVKEYNKEMEYQRQCSY